MSIEEMFKEQLDALGNELLTEIKQSSRSHSETSQAVSWLAESCDERFWTATHIEQFTEPLLGVIDDEQLIKKDLVRDALLKIAQFFSPSRNF